MGASPSPSFLALTQEMLRGKKGHENARTAVPADGPGCAATDQLQATEMWMWPCPDTGLWLSLSFPVRTKIGTLGVNFTSA